MKRFLQNGLIPGMILVYGCAFSQQIESKNQTNKPNTYLEVLLNIVSTNLNYGSSNHELSDYKKAILGAQVGASFQAGITSRLSLVSELYFIMKGGQLTDNNSLTIGKSTLRLYAFEFPVLARVHFGKFYINAGPALAYNFYGTQKMESSTNALSFRHATNGFKRFDAGIQMGGGCRFRLKQRNVALDVRYTNGLTSISHDKDLYNRYLIISLHFSNPWKTNPFARNQ